MTGCPLPLEAVIAELGLGDAGRVFAAEWGRSEAGAAEGAARLLAPAFIEENADFLGLVPALRAALHEAVPAFAERPALRRLLWHCHTILRELDDTTGPQVPHWPFLPTAPMFYALAFLSAVPAVRERHAQLGIDAAVTRDTLADLAIWIDWHRQHHGVWGLSNLGWLGSHFALRLFTLGRLQFRFEEFPFDFRAWHGPQPGQLVLLAGPGMRFRADGQFADADGREETTNVWEAAFAEEGDVVVGHPIDPRGVAVRAPVRLPRRDWRPVLGRGDPVLGIHIPATGPMDQAACGASFRQARELFARYFPGRAWRAFTCGSWTLDPQLAEYLPPDSNLVRFQREMYLHPWPGSTDRLTFERVFGPKRDRLEDYPQDTALRRAVVAHVRRGGTWRVAGAVLAPEDLRWGEEVYHSGKR